MKQNLFFLFILIALIFVQQKHALAAVIFEERFQDNTNIDLSRTTAKVNPNSEHPPIGVDTSGTLELSTLSLSNALTVLDEGWGFGVATKSGVKTFVWDNLSLSLNEEASSSIPEETGAIGIAVRNDSPSTWVITDANLSLYKKTGGMTQVASVTNLASIKGISAFTGLDQALLVRADENNQAVLEIYRESGGSPILLQRINTGHINPVNVSVVPGTTDFVLGLGNGWSYFEYQNGSWQENIAKAKHGLQNVQSVSARDITAIAVIENPAATITNINYYALLIEGGWEQLHEKSTSSTELISLSFKPGVDEYAALSINGSVAYWMWDGNSMIRNSLLSISGLPISQTYRSPGEYWSKPISTEKNNNLAKIDATIDQPSGTNLQFFISSDGGNSFSEATRGQWTNVPWGSTFVIRVLLSTINQGVTPKIHNLTLSVMNLELNNFRITQVINPPSGNPPLPTDSPIKVKAGYAVTFKVDTTGAEQVSMTATLGDSIWLSPESPVSEAINAWTGVFIVPLHAESGTIINLTITASGAGESAILSRPGQLIVEGSMTGDIIINQSR